MGDLRMGLFRQMGGTIRGHLAEASRPASGGDGFGEQERAVISLGVPEAVAEERARALVLFAEGDADDVAGDVPSILGPAGPELRNSLPPTVPQRSPDARARSRPWPGLPP